MIFDKKQVINGVKSALSTKDKGRKPDIDMALGLCLDDMCMRLKSSSFLENTTESMSAGDRTVNLTGANSDLRYIFQLKFVGSSTSVPLDRVDPEFFLKNFDDPNASRGEPTVYTVLSSDMGYPTIKLDRPLQKDDTLTVYYFSDMTPDNITKARSVAAAVAGTIAWFYGIGSVAGAPYYQRYEQLVMLARASDSFEANADSSFQMSRTDKNIYTQIQTIRSRRA